MPDHRHKPGDEHAGGRKPGARKPRPDSPRGEGSSAPGPSGRGKRAPGPRAEGPRPDGAGFEGPKSFGSRPDGPSAGGFRGRRPDGPRPDYYGPGQGGPGFGHAGPRPGGYPYGGPRPGFGGPRPGDSRPQHGGHKPGGPGSGGPGPGPSEGRPEDRRDEGQYRAPGREWQPNDAWAPRPSRPFGHTGPRPGFAGPRPGFAGPRRAYGGPRPGAAGPHPERGGFGFGEHRPDAAPQRPPRPAPPDRDFDDLPPGAAGPGPAESAEPPELSGPSARRPGPPRRPDYRARSGGYPDYRARSGGYQDRHQPRPTPPPTADWPRPPAPPPLADLLGEEEEIVAGRHPVEEAFIAHRKALRLLVVPQRRQALEKLVLHATNLRIPIIEVEGGTLTSLAGFDGHQGIALVTDRRQYAGLDDLLARAIERGEPPFVIVLDSFEDPQNFGSLLRTAEACGVQGVVYPTHRQAPLSAAAIKASAGAVEHLLLVPVDDLADALTDLHVRGLRIIGSDADAPLTARQADLRGPVAIVIGSEGQGLGPAVRRRCDTVVRIPMRGKVSSLNASVAGSILLYEASSQRAGDRPLVAAAPVDATSPEPAALEPAAETALASQPAEPGPRRRRAARAGVADAAPAGAEAPPAGAADELLPGTLAGPAVDAALSVDAGVPPAAPPEAGRSRA